MKKPSSPELGCVDNFTNWKYNVHMDNNMKNALAAPVAQFQLPAYDQLPDMGLYLEQVTTYIDRLLSPLGSIEVTGSMIRNYVKKGLVANPVQKRYYAEQIAYLISIFVLKPVLPLESIQNLFQRQKKVYTTKVAYDYFCRELQNVLQYRFGLGQEMADIGTTRSLEKEMLRSAIIAVSEVIYLDNCFRYLAKESETNS